jgi:hypothetical protein
MTAGTGMGCSDAVQLEQCPGPSAVAVADKPQEFKGHPLPRSASRGPGTFRYR